MRIERFLPEFVKDNVYPAHSHTELVGIQIACCHTGQQNLLVFSSGEYLCVVDIRFLLIVFLWRIHKNKVGQSACPTYH